MSFLGSTLLKIHKNAGFNNVKVDKFDAKLSFDFITIRFLKKIFIKIANSNRLFWPMVYVVGTKL